MEPEVLKIVLRWLAPPPEPERCPTCDQETGDRLSLTHWPHCGADLCPF